MEVSELRAGDVLYNHVYYGYIKNIWPEHELVQVHWCHEKNRADHGHVTYSYKHVFAFLNRLDHWTIKGHDYSNPPELPKFADVVQGNYYAMNLKEK